MKKKITALVIMDGFGLSDIKKGNAIAKDGAKNVFSLIKNYPSSTLIASGLSVGLPEGQMGNSEVGHLNIGGGRVVYQELTRITKSIEDGDFFDNKALKSAVSNVKKNNTKLHLMGLVSDGGVHSSMRHIFALLELAKNNGIKETFIHCFLDGRDTAPTSGISFLTELQNEILRIGYGKIATICGRFYAMDRDNRWDRVEKAYDMLVSGKGNKVQSFTAALEKSYAEGITDEFVLPTIIVENNKPVATIENDDGIIFFNFRPDRARELTRVFTQKGFVGFSLDGRKRNVNWTCLTQYDEAFVGVDVAFKPESYVNTLGEYLSKKDMTQIRIAETEKYAHVTFFFNGGLESPNKNEERVLVPSKKEFPTYDLIPEMSAYEATEKAIEAIESGKYDVMVFNLANCDMVGHTGVFDAAVNAVATVDECVKKLADRILLSGGRMFLTADHGNVEKMIDEKGEVFTAHTLNLVPFVLIDNELKDKIVLCNGKLCDIAPTMLETMGLPIPKEMTGSSLIRKK